MKMAYALMFLVGFAQFMGSNAQASATHLGKVDLDLVTIDQKGKSDKIDSEDAEFRIDWISKKCELVVKGQYAYCTLDLSRDLVNPSGEVVMKGMPQAHFESDIALMQLVTKVDKDALEKAGPLLNGQASKAFDLPFYTCGNEFSPNPNCAKTGKDLLLYNAFSRAKTNGNPSYVLRQIEVPLSNGTKLVLKLKLHDISPQKGAFNIIGNNSAGNFGAH